MTTGAMDFGNLLRTSDLGHSFESVAVTPSIVEPTALVAGAREDLVDGFPEPRGAIADSQLEGNG